MVRKEFIRSELMGHNGRRSGGGRSARGLVVVVGGGKGRRKLYGRRARGGPGGGGATPLSAMTHTVAPTPLKKRSAVEVLDKIKTLVEAASSPNIYVFIPLHPLVLHPATCLGGPLAAPTTF